jgi:hypothetical protein
MNDRAKTAIILGNDHHVPPPKAEACDYASVTRRLRDRGAG